MRRAFGAIVLLVAVTFPLEIFGQTGACGAAMEMFRQRRWSEAAAGFRM